MKIKKTPFALIFLYTLYYFTCGTYIFATQAKVAKPEIEAPAAVLMDATTGVVIYSNNMHAQKYPASLTKLMTALMLIEYAEDDFNQRITMSRNAVFSIPRGSSHIAMNEYETLTIYESLYAIMLESANEVSNAIGEHIAGDLDTFAKMMTIRAHELGATNTNFTNAHGLHHEDNYTTAYDMALIMQELIKHDIFIEVISTRTFIIPPTERQPLERILNNTHRMIQPGNFFNEYVVGGKTGFTNEASHTLATYAKKDDMEIIIVVLENQRFVTYTDTETLMNYGFKMFGDIKIFKHENFKEYIPVVQNLEGEVIDLGYATVVAQHSIVSYLPTNINVLNIEKQLDVPLYLYPPIKEGEVVGQLILKYDNAILGTVDLVTTSSVYEFIPTSLFTNGQNLLTQVFSFSFIAIVFTGIASFALVLYVVLRIVRYRHKKKYMFSRRQYASNNLKRPKYRYKYK